MSKPQATVKYCNEIGDEVSTTWEQARADLIVEGLPVRVPPTFKGQRNYPGLFWASTNRRVMVYESLLELDRLWLADFDLNVGRIATQPFQIMGREGAAPRKHVPDILLVHRDKTVTLVDVKPSAHLERPEVEAQLAWTRSLCRTKGWNYEVFTGSDGAKLRNIKALAVGRRPERLPPGLVDAARATLDCSEVTLREVLTRRPEGCDVNSWRVAVLACLWAGYMTLDLEQPLGEETVLKSSAGARA
ncbi:TnsA-like heteromeric transposase endonuclease subunit [Nesterenkonia halotolerans]|uniref:TnsA endonuclease N-terminal domain-containing protein n=1 Tax=Nesterenkonia halotolerans TaxID=225325 RepID=A0ABR9J881_9MICC|nr:TnsA-like heteromeric transposase endonuclease subunit [Nesterenkonia halotolerans]MBE1515195.1 hypothetical protein [Nesterenkonia halotolerans]